MRTISLFAAATIIAAPVLGQSAVSKLPVEPRAQVLILGMFHFQDAGLDGYKPTFPFEIRSPTRQRELEAVITRLAAWRPTRIAVESKLERQPRLDSLFAIYPGSGTDTLPNETFQIGFRLARRLNLPGVMAIDAPARFLDSALAESEWKRRSEALAPGPLNAVDWNARFTALYRNDDSLKTISTLKETLVYINSPARLAAGHGHYVVGDLLNGRPGEYHGADGFVSGWYNRNIRIYSNVVRLVRNPEERILVLIGAGHVPILRSLFQSTPVVRLIDVAAVLK